MFTPLNVHAAASSAMHTAFGNAARMQGRVATQPERSLAESVAAAGQTWVLAFNRGLRACRQALSQTTGV
jgi:hypothetical protein